MYLDNLDNDIKLNTPRSFDGRKDIYEISDFLATVHIQIATRNIENEATKIATLGRSLTGPAARWFVSYGTNNGFEGLTYDNFVVDFKNHFQGAADSFYLVQKIRELRMTRQVPIEEYSDRYFRLVDLLPDAYWSENAKIDQYLYGLPPNVVQYVRVVKPDSLQEAMETAWKHVMINMKSYKEPFPDLNSSRIMDPDAMELDAISDSRRSRQYNYTPNNANNNRFRPMARKTMSRSDCLRLGLCFRCKKGGHSSKECSQKNY
ncbi:uncharacterized protein SCODWIG_03423 [Saccharomycodes ludwigii]|uniref:CCHC-type domain-containing protein n=1 Tax=Saccharomycodes ludwigii TaxID=36035 RepID=A0A376BAI2_9ASCO|nr:hypothetical protein SCDLUD_000812 [Saccharomycodes ludwigii]KAH3903194.1 hypothetical protein SCDLUD_000812 [Saccharomycodes ludwigii]SSD61662.1 uncharacterized protein SCODWIG_03423 [Saccharomycodes ludwigii]